MRPHVGVLLRFDQGGVYGCEVFRNNKPVKRNVEFRVEDDAMGGSPNPDCHSRYCNCLQYLASSPCCVWMYLSAYVIQKEKNNPSAFERQVTSAISKRHWGFEQVLQQQEIS